MDITKFNTVQACEDGAWLTIRDFEDAKTDIALKVIGVDAKRFKTEVLKLAKKAEGTKIQDTEELEMSNIRTLVSITVDWKGVDGPDGKAIPFSKEMANEIYTNSPHIAKQVLEFAKERTNFLSEKQKG